MPSTPSPNGLHPQPTYIHAAPSGEYVPKTSTKPPPSSEMMRKATGAYEWVKQMELFAIQPAPRFERRSRYGTTLGLTVTVLVAGISIFYAVLSVSRLVENKRGSVVRGVNKPPPAVAMEPFALALPRINDPTYFTVAIEHRSQEPGKRSTKVAIPPIPDGLDRMTYKVDGFSPEKSPEALMDGDCRVGLCRYVRVKVYPCQNTTTNHCAASNLIEDIISSNYLILESYGQSTDGTALTRAFELSLKDLLSFRQRFLYDVYTATAKPNYLTSWESVKVQTLQVDSPVFSIDRIPRLRTGDDTEYCKIDFALSGVEIKEDRYFTTSLDSMGETAAFFGAISGVAALFLRAYNEHVFYTKYPSWSAFDADFVPMPLDDEEETRKAERERAIEAARLVAEQMERDDAANPATNDSNTSGGLPTEQASSIPSLPRATVAPGVEPQRAAMHDAKQPTAAAKGRAASASFSPKDDANAPAPARNRKREFDGLGTSQNRTDSVEDPNVRSTSYFDDGAMSDQELDDVR